MKIFFFYFPNKHPIHQSNGFITVLIVSYRHISWKSFHQNANKFRDESAVWAWKYWINGFSSILFDWLVFPDTHHANHSNGNGNGNTNNKSTPIHTYKACQMCKQPIDWSQHKWTTYDEHLIYVRVWARYEFHHLILRRFELRYKWYLDIYIFCMPSHQSQFTVFFLLSFCTDCVS